MIGRHLGELAESEEPKPWCNQHMSPQCRRGPLPDALVGWYSASDIGWIGNQLVIARMIEKQSIGIDCYLNSDFRPVVPMAKQAVATVNFGADHEHYQNMSMSIELAPIPRAEVRISRYDVGSLIDKAPGQVRSDPSHGPLVSTQGSELVSQFDQYIASSPGLMRAICPPYVKAYVMRRLLSYVLSDTWSSAQG